MVFIVRIDRSHVKEFISPQPLEGFRQRLVQ